MTPYSSEHNIIDIKMYFRLRSQKFESSLLLNELKNIYIDKFQIYIYDQQVDNLILIVFETGNKIPFSN